MPDCPNSQLRSLGSCRESSEDQRQLICYQRRQQTTDFAPFLSLLPPLAVLTCLSPRSHSLPISLTISTVSRPSSTCSSRSYLFLALLARLSRSCSSLTLLPVLRSCCLPSSLSTYLAGRRCSDEVFGLIRQPWSPISDVGHPPRPHTLASGLFYQYVRLFSAHFVRHLGHFASPSTFPWLPVLNAYLALPISSLSLLTLLMSCTCRSARLTDLLLSQRSWPP